MQKAQDKKTSAMSLKTLEILPAAPEGLSYFAVGPYCWGKAPTARKAFDNARENGGSGTYTLHLVNKEAEVDEVDGTLRYNSRAEGIRVNICTLKVSGY